jgi:hypothetical protein
LILFSIASGLLINSCKKEKDETSTSTTTTTTTTVVCSPKTAFIADTATGPRLILQFQFDSTQVRLNNLGNPSTIPSGHAAQSPAFNFISQHYIELANDHDSVGKGIVLYVGAQTTAGGATAIDYCSSVITAENVVFYSKALKQITPGSYKWLRVSLAYQNYNITFKATAIPGNHIGTGTLASFIGFNTYITNYQVNGTTYNPSAAAGGQGNHLQGYWAFETSVAGQKYFKDGQAPAGATTVPNPLFATSPIPAGSCLVTGQFVDTGKVNSPLVITGTETQNIIIKVSLSTNKSFEWVDGTADGYYQPEAGETVVDMGIRGLIPIKN